MDGGRGEAAHGACPLRNQSTSDRAPAQAIYRRRLRPYHSVEKSIVGKVTTIRTVGILSRARFKPKREAPSIKGTAEYFRLG